MKIFLKVVLTIIALLIILLLITIIRTLLLKNKSTEYHGSDDEKRSNDYANKLAKMIQIETVSHRDKAEVEKFRKLHQQMEELFPTVFSKLEKIEIDGNLMMKWVGKDASLDPLMLISHLDVVPAEGDWTYPPYSGTIVDGKIFGRGTGDIKSGVFAFYEAAEELLKDGYVPNCDIYLGSSCTEEIGGSGAPKMVNWLKEHNIKLYMLCDEGGAITSNPIPGINGTFAAIGIFEKGYGDLKLTAKGKGGHSSTPSKNTPIVRLAKMITEFETHNPFKVKFTPAVEEMLTGLAPYASKFYLKLVLHNLWLFKPLLTKVMPIISAEASAMLQTTIAFTMQKGSNGYNVLPQEAYVTANLRYIPFQNATESNQIVEKIAKKYNVETEVLLCNKSSNSLDLNGPQYKMVTDTIKKQFPGIGIMPYVVTGGTDSRFFDPVCNACVRFSPFNMSAAQLASMHAIDENINIDTLPQAVDYYKEIIKAQEKR